MRFIEKTGCKLSVSNGSDKQNKQHLSLDFAADSSRCNWMISKFTVG